MSSVDVETTLEFLRASQELLAGLEGKNLPLAELRRGYEDLPDPAWHAFSEAGPDVARVWDRMLPVAGAPDLRARLYQPFASADGALPSMHVHVHGGGWWQGRVDQWIVDAQCRERCAMGDSIVVSIDYRKAPETPFPCGLDDVVAALDWCSANAANLGASDWLTVSGISAGANLVAAATLVARDHGGPTVGHQILEAVPVDLRVDEPTAWAPVAGADTSEYAKLIADYVQDPADVTNPLASPLLASDLSGLPPTSVFIGTRDPFYLGAVAFAERLREAGVSVRLHEYEDFLHHTPALTAKSARARAWRAEVAAIIRGEASA